LSLLLLALAASEDKPKAENEDIQVSPADQRTSPSGVTTDISVDTVDIGEDVDPPRRPANGKKRPRPLKFLPTRKPTKCTAVVTTATTVFPRGCQLDPKVYGS
ncbi:hypothetical protein DAPPUDRAFT_126175, partial [Daphnia pulex]